MGCPVLDAVLLLLHPTHGAASLVGSPHSYRIQGGCLVPRPENADSRVGVEEGRCPIQGWIASRFERGRGPITNRFNWDKEVKDSGSVWFLLNNELSTCSMI